MDKKSDAFFKRLVATFKVEAGEHVQVLSSGLIQLEKAGSTEQRQEVIETLFRGAHSLKGAARAVNQDKIETLCQSIENVFSALKRQEIVLSAALFDLLHTATDALAKLVHAGEKAPSDPKRDAVPALCRRLDDASRGVSAQPMAEDTGAVDGLLPVPPMSPAPAEERPSIEVAQTVRMPVTRLDAVLRQVEELLSAKLTASQRAAEIQEAIAAFGVLKKERGKIVREVRATQHSLERAQRYAGEERHGVQLGKLLEFINWEGSFVKSFDSRLGALARMAEHDRRSLAGMVDTLLDDMKKVLMLPIASMLEVFPKLVRDLSRDQGKDADLVIEGGEIEIDRRILEEMRDPLTHLLRNCINHGIEIPKERQRLGKPARATITLSITQRDGGTIEMLVADDGAGIDAAKVQAAAEKLGIAPTEGSEGTEQRVLSLVFQSGVSTSPLVTDISGRGLGLAIVREKVERLSGTITVDTRVGQGTCFRMVLPVTLATYRGIHVRVHGQQFIVPTAYVQQALKIRREHIKTVENQETIPYQGKTLALVRLADVLELPPNKADAGGTVSAMIVGSASNHIAFAVDEVLYEQEVLVKSLGKQLRRVRNIAGASVLGTGKVIPILNVPDLIKSAGRLAAAPRTATPVQTQTPVARKSILVAEDSITSRMLLRNILESAGYKVTTAVDGVDAFTQLRTQRFDLVVSDVDMPRMNGFELTAKIRADKTLAELPLVLVTSLKSQEHRERGVEVGANAYIVKSSFDQSNLLEIVRRLL